MHVTTEPQNDDDVHNVNHVSVCTRAVFRGAMMGTFATGKQILIYLGGRLGTAVPGVIY